MDELKRFESDLKGSGELQKKLEEAFRRIAEEGQAKNDGEIMVAAAKELGYEISITTLEKYKAEKETLDPEALKDVDGGKLNYESCAENTNYVCSAFYGSYREDEYGHDSFCWTAWHCFTATVHSDSNDQTVSCLYDYRCLFGPN